MHAPAASGAVVPLPLKKHTIPRQGQGAAAAFQIAGTGQDGQDAQDSSI